MDTSHILRKFRSIYLPELNIFYLRLHGAQSIYILRYKKNLPREVCGSDLEANAKYSDNRSKTKIKNSYCYGKNSHQKQFFMKEKYTEPFSTDCVVKRLDGYVRIYQHIKMSELIFSSETDAVISKHIPRQGTHSSMSIYEIIRRHTKEKTHRNTFNIYTEKKVHRVEPAVKQWFLCYSRKLLQVNSIVIKVLIL